VQKPNNGNVTLDYIKYFWSSWRTRNWELLVWFGWQTYNVSSIHYSFIFSQQTKQI